MLCKKAPCFLVPWLTQCYSYIALICISAWTNLNRQPKINPEKPLGVGTKWIIYKLPTKKRYGTFIFCPRAKFVSTSEAEALPVLEKHLRLCFYLRAFFPQRCWWQHLILFVAICCCLSFSQESLVDIWLFWFGVLVVYLCFCDCCVNVEWWS